MSRSWLWLVATAALVSASSLANASPLKVMSAPNLLRVGAKENIFVECQDCTGGDILVIINVMNHPTKANTLATTSVTLNSGNDFQAFGEIKIPAGEFSRDATIKQYVYLQAQFPDHLLEKVVLVSFQSGFIFIQTDKTLYTPRSKVLYRMFAVTPRMEPVEREEDFIIDIEMMTPEGTILPMDFFFPTSGIYSSDYRLGDNVSPGIWKLVAKFRSNPQQSYTAEFEVKEYVLPSFEVKLTPVTSFFYVDSPDLIVNIKAEYLFGESVDGTAYVVFGVIAENQKKSLAGSLQRILVERGSAVATLKREHILQTFNNINDLVGKSLFVAVSVLTDSGGEMVEAELKGIQIVTSPYTIHFKKTPKYFKPGMSFDVVVEVVNPDESPASGIAVVVGPGHVEGLTADNGIAKLTINPDANTKKLTVTAKTNKQGLSADRQAKATTEALPYKTTSNFYLHIVMDTAELKLGDNLKMLLMFNRRIDHDTDITYLVLSRGQLVIHKRYRSRGQVLISQNIPITKEMLPSFRIIAYFHPNDNEVVSDSVWVDVKDTCMGSLKLESSRPAPSYEPRKMFGLKVTGDPGAVVGLVAVDKGVYVLNNKHRLTQKKVWDVVEKYDTGCTPGGGKDAMSVFYDAGLLFESNTASGTPYRQEKKCPTANGRRKRASTTTDVTTSLSEEEDNSYMDSNEIVSRTSFPESWLWSDITLPTCPRHTPDCETTTFTKHVPLQDSITTWQFTGISLSKAYGICVGEPFEVIVRKEFFIDLRLPYSAVRGEQIEIKAILHNYSPELITVRVDLLETENICSSASKRTRYRQEVNVGAGTTRSVPFVIIPMKHGQFDIEVKAAVKDSSMYDGVKKSLLVVPNGVLVKQPKTITLDPTSKGAGGKQEEILNSRIPETNLVPNTPTSTQISVTGRENIAPLVENAISGQSMGTLIYQPSGCGEQNMIHMTLPVIAAIYLDKTNQWESVGFQRRNEALEHVKTGFRNQLAYLNPDGSFGVWPKRHGSTWLTAYVVKVFAMANNLVRLDKNVICNAVKVLILKAKQPNGMFKEVGSVSHGEMQGDVLGLETHASMTAFCLIAMQESKLLCQDTVNTLASSIDKAVEYLTNHLHTLTNPYAVAMTSYALANTQGFDRGILFRFASPELSHWISPRGHIYSLEATAYALLALVKAKLFEEARPVVRWFNNQPRSNAGFGSTQATITVYQAVSEYWAAAQEPEYDLKVDIHLPGKALPDRLSFTRANHYTTRTSKISDINQDVKVTAEGSGEATLTMVSLYYVLPTEKESDCQKFDLSVELIQEKTDEKIYKLRIEVLYKSKDRDATMSVLDIGLLTGFTVNTNDLDQLTKGRARTIAKYEMNTVLSERGSLIIYLDKVSHTTPEEIVFRIHQTMKVGVLQPATVSVYEYYDQTSCVKFYHPQRMAGELMTMCTNEECTCAEENCSMQQKKGVSTELRIDKVCERDYVYKVKVVEFTDGLSTDIYTMEILDVIKEGSIDSPIHKTRKFLSYPHCRKSLGLEGSKGKHYLIMGASTDTYRDENNTYQYVLGEQTWIEYWPTVEECQTEEYRATCMGLDTMVQQYRIFGCLQ
ncbi:complement C3-like [Cynoglossus semilaevis]|uniref:complement C3-like n=1 Tax=Cynoglossus semilaevis TaxID=244447 RepID=UPI000496E772|nr:complement C3-like [Cynoglossus semilaevis]